MIKLSIIIVNWNAKDHLETCLRSIQRETKGIVYEILVVDNASNDGSVQMIRTQFPEPTLIENRENVGFARANNQAIGLSRGRYILLLNPDTFVLENALTEMTEFLDQHSTVGILGCKVLTAEGVVDLRCARRFPTLMSEFFEKTTLAVRLPGSKLFGSYLMSYWDHEGSREVDALSGACMMIRRELVENVGLLDKDFFMYGEDIDWCYRAKKAGWQICYLGGAEIVHLGAQSTSLVGDEMGIEALHSLNLFFQKHHGLAYAWAYRMLIVALSLAKQLVFFGSMLASKTTKERDQYARKICLHQRVLRWAITGQKHNYESVGRA